MPVKLLQTATEDELANAVGFKRDSSKEVKSQNKVDESAVNVVLDKVEVPFIKSH